LKTIIVYPERISLRLVETITRTKMKARGQNKIMKRIWIKEEIDERVGLRAL